MKMSKKPNKYIRLVPGDIIERTSGSGNNRITGEKVGGLVIDSGVPFYHTEFWSIPGTFTSMKPKVIGAGMVRLRLWKEAFILGKPWVFVPLPGDIVKVSWSDVLMNVRSMWLDREEEDIRYEFVGKHGSETVGRLKIAEIVATGPFSLSLLPLPDDTRMSVCPVSELCIYECQCCPWKKLEDGRAKEKYTKISAG
jgi:hypothetical protein